MTRSALASLGCIVALGLMLAGCTTFHETQPPRTASEQLIMAHAAEIAADKLASAMPTQAKAFVDDSHFKGDDADYGVSAIRAAFLKHGLILTPDRGSSDIVVEIRMGALSIDMTDKLFGLPPLSVPLPGTLTAFATPELSIFSETKRKGAAEFAAFAYDSRSGRPIAFVGPVGGERTIDQRKILTVFGAGRRDEPPGWSEEEAREKASGWGIRPGG